MILPSCVGNQVYRYSRVNLGGVSVRKMNDGQVGLAKIASRGLPHQTEQSHTQAVQAASSGHIALSSSTSSFWSAARVQNCSHVTGDSHQVLECLIEDL